MAAVTPASPSTPSPQKMTREIATEIICGSPTGEFKSVKDACAKKSIATCERYFETEAGKKLITWAKKPYHNVEFDQKILIQVLSDNTGGQLETARNAVKTKHSTLVAYHKKVNDFTPPTPVVASTTGDASPTHHRPSIFKKNKDKNTDDQTLVLGYALDALKTHDRQLYDVVIKVLRKTRGSLDEAWDSFKDTTEASYEEILTLAKGAVEKKEYDPKSFEEDLKKYATPFVSDGLNDMTKYVCTKLNTLNLVNIQDIAAENDHLHERVTSVIDQGMQGFAVPNKDDKDTVPGADSYSDKFRLILNFIIHYLSVFIGTNATGGILVGKSRELLEIAIGLMKEDNRPDAIFYKLQEGFPRVQVPLIGTVRDLLNSALVRIEVDTCEITQLTLPLVCFEGLSADNLAKPDHLGNLVDKYGLGALTLLKKTIVCGMILNNYAGGSCSESGNTLSHFADFSTLFHDLYVCVGDFLCKRNNDLSRFAAKYCDKTYQGSNNGKVDQNEDVKKILEWNDIAHDMSFGEVSKKTPKSNKLYEIIDEETRQRRMMNSSGFSLLRMRDRGEEKKQPGSAPPELKTNSSNSQQTQQQQSTNTSGGDSTKERKIYCPYHDAVMSHDPSDCYLNPDHPNFTTEKFGNFHHKQGLHAAKIKREKNAQAKAERLRKLKLLKDKKAAKKESAAKK